MPRTILIGTANHSWRSYIREHRGDRDLAVLDPMDAHHGTPGRLALYHGDKCVDWVFLGAIDAQKNPLALIAGSIRLLAQSSDDTLILFPNFQGVPAARQLLLQLAQLIQPGEIFVPSGSKIAVHPWPVGAEHVEVEAEFPEMVQLAQRRARWIAMLEQCEDHVIPLDEIDYMFSRFGSGRRVPSDHFDRAGISGVLWAERAAQTLLIVARRDFDDDELAGLLNVGHATKLMFLDPLSFSGLLCSFARQDGEEMGMGMIEEASFTEGVIKVRCQAVAPAPVRILKIGHLRIDSLGRELHEIRPWTV
ncbi:MAG: hypothetical protein JNJ45_08820 [Chthonomonas sp.]|nr:hypothetical protein [Chthonomonas sp.]